MSPSDYTSLARALCRVRASYAPHRNPNLFRACDDNARAIADALLLDNPDQFDKQQFLHDCGMEKTA